MDRDLANLKKWLTNLGLEVDGKISDEELKKLVPPQRRDMWRNIIKHVLPKENVDLIKKSILLHKLQKRQTPLKAIVETDSDLSNALKYEELLTKYNKIQKDISDTKINNKKLKADLNEKYECKKNLIKNIEFKQTKSYLAKQKIDDFNTSMEEFKELIEYCHQFSKNVNTSYTTTDYEDVLIKCFTLVDDSKERGVMNESVNIKNELANNLSILLRDKSPAILIQTIEENITVKINRSNSIFIDSEEVNDPIKEDENTPDILIGNFLQMQLELQSKLNEALIEKEDAIKTLKETTKLVKNEIISQYKLKNISCTDEEFLAFKKNLKNALFVVYKTSINLTNVVGLPNIWKYDDDGLDSSIQENNSLNEEIDDIKKNVCEMLKEVEKKKSDFGISELKVVMDELAQSYPGQMDYNDIVNKTTSSIKNLSTCDVNNINYLTLQTTPKSNVINFRALQNIKQNTEMIDVISDIATKFEQFNNILSSESKFDEIMKKENLHKSEFDSFITEIENKMLELDNIIEDSKTLANVLKSEQSQNMAFDE